MVLHGAFGMFYTPVDMNTWCNQRHNVPYRLSRNPAERQLHSSRALLHGFNFGQPVLGMTTVSFAAFDPTHRHNTLSNGAGR